jgi:hypothetical protein
MNKISSLLLMVLFSFSTLSYAQKTNNLNSTTTQVANNYLVSRANMGIPNQETLDEMKTYIESKNSCLDNQMNNCYVWEKMSFNHQGNALIVDAILNNSALDNITLPFNSNQLKLTDFSYDNLDNTSTSVQAHLGILRDKNNYILGSEAGRYHVKMTFDILDMSRISLDRVWLANGNISINNTSHEAQVSLEKSQNTNQDNDNTQKQYNLNPDVSIDKTIILNGTRWVATTTINSTQDTNITVPLLEGEHALDENQLDSTHKNISLSVKSGVASVVQSFFLPTNHIQMVSMNYPIHLNLQGSELYQAQKINDNKNVYSIQNGQNNDFWLYAKTEPINIGILVQKAIVKDTSIVNQYQVNSHIEQGKLMLNHTIEVHSSLANQLNFTTHENETIRSVSINNKNINYATLSNHTYSVPVDEGSTSITILTEKPLTQLYIANPFFKLNMPIYNQNWRQSSDGIWAVLATGNYHTSIAWVGVLLCMLVLSFFVAKRIFPMGVIASFVLLFGAMQGGLPLILLMLITFSFIQYRKTHIIRDYFTFNAFQIIIAALVIVTFYLVINSIHMSLILNHPNLYMSNIDDNDGIVWFSAYHSYIGGLIYLPLWLYKVLMLLWTFWFAYLIIDRAKWMWNAYTFGNLYWKKAPKFMTKQTVVATEEKTEQNDSAQSQVLDVEKENQEGK